MGRMIDVDDLVDAHEVAALLGLKHPNTVHQYLGRYDDMPRPVIERGGRRLRLWSREEVIGWQRERGKSDAPK